MNGMAFFRALIFSVFIATAVNGDILLSVDLDTSTPGIQAIRVAKAGDTFDVDLHMEITGSSSLAIYSFGVEFDKSELMMSTSVDVSGRAVGFEQASPVVVDNGLGRLHPLDTFNILPPWTTHSLVASRE